MGRDSNEKGKRRVDNGRERKRILIERKENVKDRKRIWTNLKGNKKKL